MNEQSKQLIFNALRPDDDLVEAVKVRAAALQKTKPDRRLIPLIAATMVLICLAALGAWRLFGSRTAPHVEIDSTASFAPTDISMPLTPTNFYAPEQIPRQADGSVRYADVSVDGKQGMALQMPSALTCIASFSERMALAGELCFEGTVVETRFKQYDFKTDYGIKFGERTIIRYTPTSQITTFRIERIWHGDPARIGTTITLEDEGCRQNSPFGYRLGVPYVVIVEKKTRPDVSDGHGETLVEGDNIRDSVYATLYPFQPQIERTRHGQYIVPTSWETLTRGNDTPLHFDEETPISGGSTEFEYFRDKLRLVDRNTFLDRMTALMQTND